MFRAHYSRRTAGVAALLPALMLAALYVAAPFAGTTTHAIAHRSSLGPTTFVLSQASVERHDPVPGQGRIFE